MNWSCCHHLGFTPPCFFIFFIFLQKRAKKIYLPATFRKQNLLFFVPRISLFSAGCTRPSDALLRYSIVDVLNNTNKKKKESKKGPRNRERESLGESYVVHRHHRHPFSSSRAKKKEHIFEFAVKNSKRRFDATRHELTEDILNQCLLGQSEEDFEKVRKYARLNKETEDKNGGTLVTQQMKFHIKLGRQLGIHVSPTCCLNGLVCDTSSSWTLKEWKAFLDPYVRNTP